MNLNIIGNGFDLYHGMPSSYYYFGCYLAASDECYYEKFAQDYDFRYGINFHTYPDFEYEPAVENKFWSELEKHLGDINENFIVDTHNYDLNLECPDPYKIPMDEDTAADVLKEKFTEWIRETVDLDKNYEIIRRYVENNRFNYVTGFTDDDYFLVFNYTHILQNIYNIKSEKIHYVHGENTGSDDDELIIGHCNDNRIEEIEEKVKSYDNADYTQVNVTKENEYRCLLRYIEKLRKDVRFCMSMVRDFCMMYSTKIDAIKVYGMSFGEVDIPYFKMIKKMYPDTKWYITYFDDAERERLEHIIKNDLKLSEDKFELFEFRNSEDKVIRGEIVVANNIQEFECLND